MEKEKQKKEEIKIKIEDLPKQIDQQSISSEDRVPRKRKIKVTKSNNNLNQSIKC